MDSSGPTQDQLQKLPKLPFFQFVKIVELLGLDPTNYSQIQPPGAWVMEFRNATKAAEINAASIELALVSVVQPGNFIPTLDLLDIPLPKDQEKGSLEWFSVIRQTAASRNLTVAEIKTARLNAVDPAPVAAPEWQPPEAGHLEQIMDKQNTLLPINYLAKGLKRSRAVAKLEVVIGGKRAMGTGFVIEPNLIVTNAHVIPDSTVAETAVALFNYEKDVNGADLEPLKIKLAPAKAFIVSPVADYDLAVIALAEDSQGRWDALPLKDKTVAVDDPVCIIQHPGGDQKHIGMTHNTVTYVDERLVQYLTDTLPGSSGSPIFDGDWDLVGVHHAGGWVREPSTKRTLFRNEGIRLAHLQALVAQLAKD